jgi:hypothetical protein
VVWPPTRPARLAAPPAVRRPPQSAISQIVRSASCSRRLPHRCPHGTDAAESPVAICVAYSLNYRYWCAPVIDTTGHWNGSPVIRIDHWFVGLPFLWTRPNKLSSPPRRVCPRQETREHPGRGVTLSDVTPERGSVVPTYATWRPLGSSCLAPTTPWALLLALPHNNHPDRCAHPFLCGSCPRLPPRRYMESQPADASPDDRCCKPWSASLSLGKWTTPNKQSKAINVDLGLFHTPAHSTLHTKTLRRTSAI